MTAMTVPWDVIGSVVFIGSAVIVAVLAVPWR